MRPSLQRQIGQRIRAIRTERSLTQDQLGVLLGHSDGRYIGAIERGERNLSSRLTEELAHKLEVPVDALVASAELLRAADRAGHATHPAVDSLTSVEESD